MRYHRYHNPTTYNLPSHKRIASVLQESHLQALYGDLNNPFRTTRGDDLFACFPASVILIVHLICYVFNLVALVRTSKQCKNILKRTYAGVVRGDVRGPPLFQHTLWNVYDRVMNDLPRTLMAWQVQPKRLGQCHANVWNLFRVLLPEHATMHLGITRNAAGVTADLPSRVYR